MAEVDKKELETSEAVENAVESESKSAGKKTDTSKKKQKKSFWEKVKKFWRDYKSEFNKIVWPTRKQTIRSTAVVLIALVVCAVVIGLLDLAFSKGLNTLVSII